MRENENPIDNKNYTKHM